MNAHSRNRFYAEEFDPPPSQGLAIFCGVVLAVAALICGFWSGMEFQSWLDKRQREMDARKGPPPRVIPQKHDPLAKYCAAPREFAWVCKQRRTAI
jgi:hypothetical protein